MLFGFDSFAAQPWSTTGEDQVTVTLTKNQLEINIGNVNIIADSIIEDVTKNQFALGLGTLTISGGATTSITKNPLTLAIKNVIVKVDASANVTKNELTLLTTNVIVTGGATIVPSSVGLNLNTVEPGIITWNNIIPGVNMIWTPIEPF